MNDLIESLIRESAAKREPGDYIQDGLLYCGHCGTPKQCRITLGGGVRIVGRQCACRMRRYINVDHGGLGRISRYARERGITWDEAKAVLHG